MASMKFTPLIFLTIVIWSQALALPVDQLKSHSVGQSNLSLANDPDLYSFVVLGASGDLAKRSIYPALWKLYQAKLLPPHTVIYGFARSDLKVDDIRKHVEPFVKISPEENQLYNEFWSKNRYIRNYKTENEGYDNLCNTLKEAEGKAGAGNKNRVFYLSLPPSLFESSTLQLKRACMADKGWTRLIVEKPFGYDSKSSEKLSSHLSKLFTEEQIYRMDHFLGEEVVQNILTLRFGNRILSPVWNRNNIASIQIDFRENFGIAGRGAFFDGTGIIRDVMQNHLLQILSLVAMEQPKSSNSDDVRDEKVRLLKNTRSIAMKDVVLGQFESYLDEPQVPKDSLQSTFALTVLKVDNSRWRGVPFMIRAGKGLNVNTTDVIIQFKNVDKDIFSGKTKRNKLIIRVGVNDHFVKTEIMSKKPGFTNDIEEINLGFDYKDNYKGLVIPSAYEKQILDIFRGSKVNFVRTDELREAWRIFTPMLHEIESKKIAPIKYKYGTTGPKEADDLEKKYNFLR